MIPDFVAAAPRRGREFLITEFALKPFFAMAQHMLVQMFSGSKSPIAHLAWIHFLIQMMQINVIS